MEAVTTGNRAWREAEMAAAMSIHCMRMPPKIAPCAFVSPGKTTCAVSTRDARGENGRASSFMFGFGNTRRRNGQTCTLDCTLQIRLSLVVTLVVTSGWAPATALGKTYTLPELLDLAKKRNPSVAAASAATAQIEAQLSEARRSWLVTGELVTLLAPSPDIQCEVDTTVFPQPPGVDATTWRQQHCYRTNVSEATLRLNGVFSRTELKLVQPLFTFGKISAGVSAAQSGIAASKGREAGVTADLELNVKKAYWGAKLAREMLETLDEGLTYIEDAQKKIDKDLAEGTGDVTITDRLRLRTVRAEVDARLLEAKRGQSLAQAGLRALLGAEAGDEIAVDNEALVPVNVPARPPSFYEEQARLSRPEVHALNHLVASKRALAELEWRKQYPDLVLLGTASFAYASSVDNPQHAFASDPYNSKSAGLAAALRWPLDLGIKNARAAKARAEAQETEARRREALGGIVFEVNKALAELNEAQQRADVLARGEKAGKQWITSVAQNFAAGLAEAKDFSDALVTYFQFRARHLQALFDINMAAATLSRATGSEVTSAPSSPATPE